MAHKSHAKHHNMKGEVAHHKAREAARNVHRSKEAGEHSTHEAMTSKERVLPPEHLKEHPGFVSDSHQEGISRVMQRPGDMEVGQHGSMSIPGWNKKE